MSETPQVVMNEAERRFEIALEGETAYAEYRLTPDNGIILPHTVVPKAFEGRGYASLLARTALAYARDHGLKVSPTCPFMAGYIAKHPEWHDVVADHFKTKLGIEA